MTMTKRATVRAAALSVTAATLFAATLFSGPVLAADPAPAPEQLASLQAMQQSRADLPKVLSADDADRYRKIFAYQDKADWARADGEIAKLSDPVLMGHVLAERYLHPTSYRSKYVELKDWLAEYKDMHYAQQVYKLALSRRPANHKYPDKPQLSDADTSALKFKVDRSNPSDKTLSRSQRRQAFSLKNQLKSHLRKGNTLAAKRIVESPEAKALFSAYDMDWAKERLARGYFMDGEDQRATQWSEAAANRSGKHLPQSHWTAGLSNWRLGNIEKAAEHFEKAAQFDRDPWTHAASSFWAARAYLIARKPERVMPLLEDAAQHQRTFYGMLATKLLGREPQFNWTMPAMNGQDVGRLTQSKGGKRALALLQVGEDALAEKELRQVARLSTREDAAGILAIAAQAGMAELAVRLDEMLHPDGGGFDGAAYPLPTWQPADGFKIDRALIYALVRQESRFNPNAKSVAGARGLMQLMPGTAQFVARHGSIRLNDRSELFDPEFNLKLGQRYIAILLQDDKINGDLFLMAAAWNGGPGNLNKWRRQVDDMNDPLFFIESLPSRETRIFIEHVLTNLWIYRYRLGQPVPSLDAVASGVWPGYEALGQEPRQVAENVQD